MRFLWSILVLLLVVLVSAGDEAALLTSKARLSNGGSLASWNSSSGFCSWEGVTCGHRTPARVVALRLRGAGLVGALSPAIGNLTFLRTLDLSTNSLHGDIPASLGRLRRLQLLYLSDNSFSGTFPVNLSSCVSMSRMRLDNNTLGGRIPAELGEKITYLALITLRNNSFTGTIPASLANQFLDLSNNQPTRSIPPELSSIQGMPYFALSVNLITGMLPPSLFNWSSLEAFAVGSNMLYGRIPDDIGNNFPKLKVLSFPINQFTGVLPSSISNMSDLPKINLFENRFSGYVPPTLGKLGAIQNLDFAHNTLKADDNKGWEFITSLANRTRLQRLSLGTNSFGGQLPGSIMNHSATLSEFHIANNMVYGVIPTDIGNLVGFF
ncbi:hypothetical protein VPH35_114215 [Triticum aestivum]